MTGFNNNWVYVEIFIKVNELKERRKSFAKYYDFRMQ